MLGNLRHTRHLVLLLLASCLLLIASCTEEPATTSSNTSSPQTAPARKVVSVAQDDVDEPWSGEHWPFTVPSGQVELVGHSSVVFHHDGTAYAINGTARTAAARKGWTDIMGTSLWRDAPGGYGKVDISPIINLGLGL